MLSFQLSTRRKKSKLAIRMHVVLLIVTVRLSVCRMCAVISEQYGDGVKCAVSPHGVAPSRCVASPTITERARSSQCHAADTHAYSTQFCCMTADTVQLSTMSDRSTSAVDVSIVLPSSMMPTVQLVLAS